ncbi:hypothetical protein HW115_08410 [Verrucomicrobiaceae bacterium N1E253]|uniref:Uncharacterized protein n=1 Tax=Oceaniferula marina TaxID=2748318 RepID=A0A851GIC8_9BACT|nr:hypothetical protein [Oceaniferula marina]NWK55631.1 hypothetical protein [Oceaniferula marina]
MERSSNNTIASMYFERSSIEDLENVSGSLWQDKSRWGSSKLGQNAEKSMSALRGIDQCFTVIPLCVCNDLVNKFIDGHKGEPTRKIEVFLSDLGTTKNQFGFSGSHILRRYIKETCEGIHQDWVKSNVKKPLVLGSMSLIGWMRNLYTDQEIVSVYRNQPKLFTEMVITVSECLIELVFQLFDQGIIPDVVDFREDLNFDLLDENEKSDLLGVMARHYQKITTFFEIHGTTLFSLSVEICTDSLSLLWLEGGINVLNFTQMESDVTQYRGRTNANLRILNEATLSGFCGYVSQNRKQLIGNQENVFY